MGSEAAQQGSHAARFPDQPITQQHVQQARQQNHSQAQQQLEPAQQQSLDYLLDIISQVAKDDPTGVFEYPVVSWQCPGISSGLGLATKCQQAVYSAAHNSCW